MTLTEQEVAQGAIEMFRDQGYVNANEIDIAREPGDTLLSKLISGELRVPEAEEVVEGAA